MPCFCGDSECPSCGLAQGTLTRKRDPFSKGKRCIICSGPVLNRSKVLTCQQCRAAIRKAQEHNK